MPARTVMVLCGGGIFYFISFCGGEIHLSVKNGRSLLEWEKHFEILRGGASLVKKGFVYPEVEKKIVQGKCKWYRDGHGHLLPVSGYPSGRVAQLDRVSASEAEGRGFESHLAHHSIYYMRSVCSAA